MAMKTAVDIARMRIEDRIIISAHLALAARHGRLLDLDECQACLRGELGMTPSMLVAEKQRRARLDGVGAEEGSVFA